MSSEYELPLSIRRKLTFHFVKTLILGTVCIVSLICLYFFYLQQYISPTDRKLFEGAYATVILVMFMFLIVVPIVNKLTGTEIRRITRAMKDCQITAAQLSYDYDIRRPIGGKVKAGNICTYYQSLYQFNVVPNEYILWVYKNEKIKKSKRVNRSLDGTVKNERYLISYSHSYQATLKMVDGRSVVIPCQKEKTADKIIAYYRGYPHIMIGEGADRVQSYKQARKAFKKSHKGK